MAIPNLADYWPVPPQNYTVETYIVSEITKGMHSLHESLHFPDTSTNINDGEEYAMGLLWLVAPFALLGVLCLLGFLCGGLCSCFSACCCSKQNGTDAEYQALEDQLDGLQPGPPVEPEQESQCCRKTIYLSFSVLVLAGVFAVYLGDGDMGASVATTLDVAMDANNIAAESNTLIGETEQHIHDIIDHMDDFQQTCDVPLPDFSTTLNSMLDSLAGFNVTIIDLENALDTLEDGINTYEPIRAVSTEVSMAFVALVVVLAVSSVYIECCSCLFKSSRVFGVLMITILFPFAGVMFAGDVALSDFCMNPDTNAVSFLEGSVSEIAEYYVSCNTQNPFQEQIGNATAFLQDAYEQAYDGLDYVEALCDGDDLDTYHQIMQAVNQSYGGVADSAVLVDCSTINPLYAEMTYDNVCSSLVSGMYYVWLGAFLIALFLALVMACRPTRPKADTDHANQAERMHFEGYAAVPGAN